MSLIMADSAGPSDAAIDGIEPENYLPLKGTVSLTLVPGMPSDTITRLRGTYYKCDCTTFMIVNQRKEPQLRDCEHLQHFLGESYNRARISKAVRLVIHLALRPVEADFCLSTPCIERDP